MDITIKNNLCKGLRAAGLRKKECLEVTNTIERWYNSNGPEWTVERLKALHHWYETVLAGNPTPPSWFGHDKTGYPKGIWNKVFHSSNPAKALAVLSAHTIFKNEEITSKQREKFLGALNAGELEVKPEIPQSLASKRVRLPDLKEQLSAPGFDCITGNSIPVSADLGKLHPRSESERILAYCKSWQYVPVPTLDYLARLGRRELIPPALLGEGDVDERGNTLYNVYQEQYSVAGFIGCIQQPSLKARWIANPNRITQHFTEPLGRHWYGILRKLPTDCTFNQESGVDWVRAQLAAGNLLAGADLTSATDLLDRHSCLRLICKTYLGRDWDNPADWTLPVEQTYRASVDHFMAIASMSWVYPDGSLVSWDRGQPLGTYPSFAMLGLTNNALGQAACRNAGIPEDSFRVIGDDIIMDARALPHYVDLVEGFGGIINQSKTLTSSLCAEFAGRVITAQRSMNKTVKYKDMSDNSFMQIVSDLGDQAKALLRPRQRNQYDKFKFVPGIAVPGPYPQNSFGVPLWVRYAWYLTTELSAEGIVPDIQKLDSVRFARQIFYTLSENNTLADFEYSVPYSFADDFQSSLASAVVRKGDPRLANGMTCLQALERISSKETFQSFQDYIESEQYRMDCEIHEHVRQHDGPSL